MMAAMFALAEAATTPPSVVVIDAGPAHAGCPDLELTQREVAERVHGLDSEGGQWVARYVVTQSSVPGEAELVRLELSDPEGRVRLRREFALSGESCEDVARAMALVLERYFADVAAEADASKDEPAMVAPAQPAPPPKAAARAEPSQSSLRVGLGAALVFPDVDVAAELQLRFDAGFWSAGVRGALPPAQRSEDFGSGQSAELSKVPLRAWFAIDWQRGPLELSLGPEVLVSIEQAELRGFSHGTGGNRVVLGVGPQVGALYSLASRVALTVAAGGDVTLPLATSQLLVGNASGPHFEVLRPRWFEGFVAAGVTFSIF